MFLAQQAGAALSFVALVAVAVGSLLIPIALLRIKPELRRIGQSLEQVSAHLKAMSRAEDPRVSRLKDEIAEMGYDPDD